jgi:hypothetical protein
MDVPLADTLHVLRGTQRGETVWNSNEVARRQDLIDKLQELRPILVCSGDTRFLELFDDLLDHHEFGLALNCVCDYLLDIEASAPDSLTIERVKVLHAAMQVEDDCVVRLLAKARQIVPN